MFKVQLLYAAASISAPNHCHPTIVITATSFSMKLPPHACPFEFDLLVLRHAHIVEKCSKSYSTFDGLVTSHVCSTYNTGSCFQEHDDVSLNTT
jgi:hypothetical protein